MSGTTTNGITYPTSGDNIAPLEDHFQTLAQDTDALIGTYPRILRQVGIDLTTSDATATSGTTEKVIATVSATLVSGKQYCIEFDSTWDRTVLSDDFLVRIREDSLTGTIINGQRMPAAAALTGEGFGLRGFHTAAGDGAKTFVATVVRVGGTGTITRRGSATGPTQTTVTQVT